MLVAIVHSGFLVERFNGSVGDVVLKGTITLEVTFNVKLANYERKELNLTGWGLLDIVPTAEEEALEATAEPVRILEPAASNVRPPGSCALPEVPYGEREDSAGMRFGLVQGSRLEYDRPPDSFDRNIVFSVQLRATAANGIIMFVTNEKHSDYIALYMIEGRIGFSVGSGTSKLTILSKRSVLDDEWHTIRAERKGAAAALFIDGHTEAESRVEGTETVDALAPLYIGGLPTDLLPLSSNILPGIKSEFGGCLREFKLNDKKFDDTARDHGVVPCSQYTEEGLYFGKEGGYAILQQEFMVGTAFAFEMEVKPRTKNSVLLYVGVLEFVTLQILNGTIKFSVDSGEGTESVVYVPPVENDICDGHWHQISLFKKNNLIMLNVDGKSNLRIMKTATETSTKDPLYLGGVPKDVKRRGLGTVDPYVGCMRVLSVGEKTRRRRRNVDLSSIELFGMTNRTSCPLN
ncbi:laminin-like protein K08C7.3 precursor [Aphelenchoides avenae]|nr:laminin-like protein K08C7.3 precursor [Aphelenchus avenae]